LTSFERILLRAQQRLTQRIHKLAHKNAKNKVCNPAAAPSRADTQTTVNCREQAFSQGTRLLVITRFIVNYPTGSPVSGLPTIRSERTAASTPDFPTRRQFSGSRRRTSIGFNRRLQAENNFDSNGLALLAGFSDAALA